MPRSGGPCFSLSISEWKLSASEGSESFAFMVESESSSSPPPRRDESTANAVNAERAAIGRRPSEGGTPDDGP